MSNELQDKLLTQSIVATDLFLGMNIAKNEIDSISNCLKTNLNFHTLKIDRHSKSTRLVLSEIFNLPVISTKIKAVHLCLFDDEYYPFDIETWQIIFKTIQNVKTHITEMVLKFKFTYSDNNYNINEYIRETVFNNLRDLIQNQHLKKLAIRIIRFGLADGTGSLNPIELLNDIGNSSVKSLELDFYMGYLFRLSENDFQSIFETIFPMNNKLINFRLEGQENIEGDHFDNRGLDYLSDKLFHKFISFLSNSTQLQKLHLLSTDVYRLNDERFKQLLTALSKLINLKHLVIDHEWLDGLPYPLFQQLCQTISKLKKIKYLLLDCWGQRLSPEATLALTEIPNNLPELYYFNVIGLNRRENVPFEILNTYFNSLNYSAVEDIGNNWVYSNENWTPDAIKLLDNFNGSAAIKIWQRKREIRQDLVEYCLLISQIQRQNPDFEKLPRDIIHHIIEYIIGSDFCKKQITDLFDFVASNGRKWKTSQHRNGSNYRFFQSPVSKDVHFYALVRIHTTQDIQGLYSFYSELLNRPSYNLLNVQKYLASPNEPYQFADLFTKIAKRALELANSVGYENISKDDAKNFYRPLLALDEIGKHKRPSETLLEFFNRNLFDTDGAGMAKFHKTA
jgi:hypothetical protein